MINFTDTGCSAGPRGRRSWPKRRRSCGTNRARRGVRTTRGAVRSPSSGERTAPLDVSAAVEEQHGRAGRGALLDVPAHRIRLQAVARFEGGVTNKEITAALRVSERSVQRWRRARGFHLDRGHRSSCSDGQRS
ncbi:helix-turn-helix domain-containing protein [Streptomyces sp. NPDC021356]|uniref:helix-turn-helix domain-containing protein n=1 Tax=Streptomyces sp. NPDC021356 TaxID=3154900 RepID=UPI0033F713AC